MTAVAMTAVAMTAIRVGTTVRERGMAKGKAVWAMERTPAAGGDGLGSETADPSDDGLGSMEGAEDDGGGGGDGDGGGDD